MMIVRSLFIIIFLIILSCHQLYHQSRDFEIVKIDYHNNKLQRVFVVAASSKAYDTAFIRSVICSLKSSYLIDEKSAVSFFADKKYADYKTELFMNSYPVLPSTAYKAWQNSYTGEYEFETNVYKTFPISNLPNKQNVYILKSCR